MAEGKQVLIQATSQTVRLRCASSRLIRRDADRGRAGRGRRARPRSRSCASGNRDRDSVMALPT